MLDIIDIDYLFFLLRWGLGFVEALKEE